MNRRAWIALNLALGPLVLLSYVACIVGWPEQSGQLWGDLPSAVIPAYVGNMFLAAAGYFALGFALLKVDEGSLRSALGRGFAPFVLAYGLMLLGSALWMPLCVWAVATGASWGWWLIFADLGVVAVSSLAMLLGAATLEPAPASRVAAVVGAGFFCLQTVVLDFGIWPWFFSVPAGG